MKTAWLKVPIFRILLLTASSDNVGLKIKVREEILADPQALEFLKSVQGEPSYGCLKLRCESMSLINLLIAEKKAVVEAV